MKQHALSWAVLVVLKSRNWEDWLDAHVSRFEPRAAVTSFVAVLL
jgi:hypothetical protein